MNIEDIARGGKVTAVNNEKRIAKVWFDDLEIDPDYVDHKHKLVIKPYMPKVNDLVLVLYFPVFNGDGVILGGVKPWR